jgi:hypothetical protein
MAQAQTPKRLIRLEQAERPETHPGSALQRPATLYWQWELPRRELQTDSRAGSARVKAADLTRIIPMAFRVVAETPTQFRAEFPVCPGAAVPVAEAEDPAAVVPAAEAEDPAVPAVEAEDVGELVNLLGECRTASVSASTPFTIL